MRDKPKPPQRNGAIRKEEPMSDYEARIFAAELRTAAPELDLHGLWPRDVHEAINNFLRQYIKRMEVESVNIIYGFGTGALRDATWKVLEPYKKRGIVTEIVEKGGHCIVVFER